MGHRPRQQNALCHRRVIVAATGVVVLLAGCGRSADVAAARGVVKLDGKPLPGALVILEPTAGPRIQSTGITDANGEFQLRSSDAREGAIVGAHRVVVRSAARFSVVTDREGELDESNDPPPVDEIPVEYTRFDRTPLEQEIVAGENDLVIELKGQPKVAAPAE